MSLEMLKYLLTKKTITPNYKMSSLMLILTLHSSETARLFQTGM